MKTIFENNGGSYTQQGNYLLPNLTLSDGIEKQIGVWGIRHKRYLKSNHRVLYYNLLSTLVFRLTVATIIVFQLCHAPTPPFSPVLLR